MSSLPEGEDERASNQTLSDLVDGRRRLILSILLDRSAPVDEAALAERVVAAERDDVTTDAIQSARVELHHVHLPALEDAGLVDREAGEASAAEHPALENPAMARLIETEAEDWDGVVAALADERRRRALAVLASRDGTMTRFALAREIAAREDGRDPSTRAIDEVMRTLYHVHLPKLRDAGLIETEEETVSYEGHPELDASLFDDRSAGPYQWDSDWLVRCLG